MSGGSDPGNALAGASGPAQAFGYGQNVSPTAQLMQQGQMPQWQQGLLGALTGSNQYGQNAPAIHKALLGAFQRPQSPMNMGPGPAQHMRMPIQPPPISSLMGQFGAPAQPTSSPFAPFMGGPNGPIR